MDIRGFRPREGWRAFAGEVGVIVLGVLIALLAQQIANDWQWRQDVARTKVDLDSEISDAVATVAERAAVEPCLTQRLTDLADRIAASDGRWKADPYVLPGEHAYAGIIHYAIPPAYRMPNRSYFDDAWQQAKAAGMLGHMTPEEVRNYALAYLTVGSIRTAGEAERDLAPELSLLSFNGALDVSTRARALSTIARLDNANRDTLAFARQLADEARALGIYLSPTDEKTFSENLDAQQKFRGPCVDPDAALKLIGPLRDKAAGPQR